MSRRLGLCVGVNSYPGTSSNLRGCVNDAKDWRWLLQAYLPGIDALTLYDEAATRDGILDALSACVLSLGKGDILYFTFSGHGTHVPDTSGDERDRRDEAICPSDVMTAGPILDDELNYLFAQRAAGSKVVVIADSCFSGNVAKAATTTWIGPRTNSTRAAYAAPKFLPPARIPADAWVLGRHLRAGTAKPEGVDRDEAWMTVSACRDFEVSYDAEIDGRACGAFSNAATKAYPGCRSYMDWMRRIRLVLPNWQYPQTPNLTGSRAARWRKALG